MDTQRNSDNAMWRAYHAEKRARRDVHAERRLAELLSMATSGELIVKQFSEHHFRVWLGPYKDSPVADYWPHTGTVLMRGERRQACRPTDIREILNQVIRS